MKPSDIIGLIDPGHGTREYTRGKHSPDCSYYEGEWSRAMAPCIMGALKEIGISSRLIVPERQDIPLQERCRRANAIMAANPGKQLFYISLHTNAAPGAEWNSASGLCVYVSKKASDLSKALARNIYDAGAEMGLAGNRSVPPEHYWQANFTVITATRMPAVLTESLFHTNRREVEFLLSEKGQETITNMHVIGIARTFGIPCTLKSSSLPR